MPSAPAPIAVTPSGEFDGNDGLWSSFTLRVGNPAKDLRVLISTLVPETWVVDIGGCTSNDPSDCDQDRGELFNSNSSTTWQDQSEGNQWSLMAEVNLGYDRDSHSGAYGYDTLGIPAQGAGHVTLDHQVIAAITTQDFYMGNLGLAARPIYFDDQTNPQQGFLSSLRSNDMIPSLAYGYTAGAAYRSNTTASLTLGGFDVSRFTPNDISFSFAPVNTRDLVVGLQSITFSNSKTTGRSLLPKGILTFVDSTVPHIYLPTEACEEFEKSFGITWDPMHSLYVVNDTMHDDLVSENANVTFQLGNDVGGGPTIDITLPYASFDLEMTLSTSSEPIRYFPLKQALVEEQYTLGRTFLQEAFLTVDYERNNFSISQCVFPADRPSHIVAIPSINSTKTTTGTGSGTGTDTGTTSSSPPSSSSTTITITHQPSHSLPTSAIAGIAIAMVALAILLASIAYFLIIRKRKRKQKAMPKEIELAADCPVQSIPGKHTNPDSDDGYDNPKIIISEKFDELDGRPIGSPRSDSDTATIVEMSADHPVRSELSSPEPGHWQMGRSGLVLPEAEATRSATSSPGPQPWDTSRYEMPSPQFSSRASRTISVPSPELGIHRASQTLSPEITSRTDLLSETLLPMHTPSYDFPSPYMDSLGSALVSPAPALTRFDYPNTDVETAMSDISSPGPDTGTGSYFGHFPGERSDRTDSR